MSTLTPAMDSPIAMPETKKRPRRGRKANKPDIKPKKGLLLDELGDTLVNQLCAPPKLDDPLNVSCGSVADHLRSNLTAALTTPSCTSSSSSSRTLTGFDTTPPTSLDSREIPELPSSTSLTQAKHSPASDGSSHTKYVDSEHASVFSLDDFSTMTAIEGLAAHYGRVAHMGILDRSYRFFVNKKRTAALSFKVQNGVAIVGGDPLCEPDAVAGLLAEFAAYRRRHLWGIAFMGASESFVRDVAQPQGWTTIRFGTERVLDPQTNEVLLERGGKRIAVQNRQLLHPDKGGISLGVYAPTIHGTDPQLQADLVAIYDAWRTERNCSASPQAFITVYDPFALPALMTFVYTRGPDGQVNGLAALRRLAGAGYHVDPCIAAPGSPKGISDLLLVAAMALLNRTGVSYLGFGFEPLQVLAATDTSGMPGPLANLTSDLYAHAFRRLPIRGKKAYHDKFRPDPAQDSGLYIVFPGGFPGPRHLLAMAHIANISLRKVFWTDVRSWALRRKAQASTEGTADPPDRKDQTSAS
ncbi:hypothetical protein NUU61_000273 [Penicillium alfredii]|uniref:Phosphatidylglycerol lysyltransferase C-terminal domain-containing protein n=1 Tax=Penicillium alfredii TaxID=1506179 RepID=A0A9W9G9P2_9EURO|nr:uncharacterized protein NUU61_000273 [Penicillium alfredii]KAJ5114514.1 hypothetical protein NUU61_000273 [Penicillium alfredii]